ncbi:protein mono-ADP-ribosyltransferase PARP10-like isoform X3 [Narcine bancroftii]|uniref:protein mono-ADP-ribosyltransferase PARP10-like isoform X3 n=1 Tax=Narcine bancroftii TaxID=1343680 RepID=UPI003831052A
MAEQRPSNEFALEVCGVGSLPTDILTLYFENKRRSGGGAISSIARDGDHMVITFENPADAKRVLLQPEHTFQDTRLMVKRVPPNDPRTIVLRDLTPEISDDVLTLFLENITGLDGEQFTVHSRPDRTKALIRFQDALPAGAFEEMKTKASSRLLQGATILVEQVPHPVCILVENLNPADDEEIVRLYFESRRSDGGTVLNVTMVPGGKAIVEFQEWEVTERVLQKQQVLQGREMVLHPYYSFLAPPTEDQGRQVEARSKEETATQHSILVEVRDALKLDVLRHHPFLQELRNERPDLSMEVESGEAIRVTGRDIGQIQKGKSRILEFLDSLAQVDVPVNEDLAAFLSKTDVRDHFRSVLAPSSCYAISGCTLMVTGLSAPEAREAANLIEQQVSEFSVAVMDQQLHVLTSPEWEKLLPSLRCCEAWLTDAGDRVWFTSLDVFCAENQGRVESLMRESVVQESVIAMEPGKLRYLQDYHQDLLSGHGQVSIFPLEGNITGLRVTGNGRPCQTMDELLRSIISNICSRTVTLQQPGILRFLLEKSGADILKELEKKYQCIIGLERDCWIEPQSEHPLETQKNQGTPRFERYLSTFTELPVSRGQPADITTSKEDTPDLDKIRTLLASIKDTDQERKGKVGTMVTSRRTAGGSENDSDEEDIYTDPWGNGLEEGPLDNGIWQLEEGDDDKNNNACGVTSELVDSDDDAQLYLALQYSMDSRRLHSKEEEDFQKALKLSKMDISPEGSDRERTAQVLSIETSGLEEAIKLSMADAILASNTAHMTIYGSAELDFDQLKGELERMVESLVCEKFVWHTCFQDLPSDHRSYLEYLQWKHAVAIDRRGRQLVLCGFRPYVEAAAERVNWLVDWVVGDQEAATEEASVAQVAQWVRHSQQGVAIPYTSKANAFMEKAFQQKQKKVDVMFDNKPYILDFEQMKEYNIGAAETLLIERRTLNRPTDIDTMPLTPGSVELVQLNEATEEYANVISHFDQTLKHRRDKVKILKVRSGAYSTRCCFAKAHVTAVEMVHNPLLYQQYLLKKTSMEVVQSDVERVLYHGTSEESAKEIYVHGFNRSFSGKNAAIYGQGVYFATSAIISVDDQYSPPNPKGHKFIFVVNVLTGSYTKGNVKMVIPPLKEDGNKSLRYDSVVDNCDNPKIFVVFHDTQAYPQFLVTCKWK